MANQVPGGFFGLDILLSANMAILPLHLCITVEAILFFSLFQVAQVLLILLKIIKFTGLYVYGIIYVNKR